MQGTVLYKMETAMGDTEVPEKLIHQQVCN